MKKMIVELLKYMVMMKMKHFMVVAAALMVVNMTACKREVSLDKVKQTIVENITAEQRDSGNTLTVDSVILNKSVGGNFRGKLFGHTEKSEPVVYDLNVVDEGDELSAEWTLQEVMDSVTKSE